MEKPQFNFCRVENMNDCIFDEHSDTNFYSEINLLESGLNNPQINFFDVNSKPAIHLGFDDTNDIIQYLDNIIRVQRTNERLIKKLKDYLRYVISFNMDLDEAKKYYLNKLKE